MSFTTHAHKTGTCLDVAQIRLVALAKPMALRPTVPLKQSFPSCPLARGHGRTPITTHMTADPYPWHRHADRTLDMRNDTDPASRTDELTQHTRLTHSPSPSPAMMGAGCQFSVARRNELCHTTTIMLVQLVIGSLPLEPTSVSRYRRRPVTAPACLCATAE